MKQKKGFTLIEILAVIAIIAVLTSLSFPLIGKAKAAAERLKISNNMRQIITAYNSLSPETLKDINSMEQLAKKLAAEGDLVKTETWIIKGDPAIKKRPKTFINDMEGEKLPCSFEMAKIEPNEHSTTPLIWTRSLAEAYSGPTENPPIKGKHLVGFSDGHIETISDEKINEKPFFSLKTKKATSNLKEALPEETSILQST